MLIGVLLLTGCITVADFGPYWENSRPDHGLIGQWENTKPKKAGLKFALNDNRKSLSMDFTGATEGEAYEAVRTLRLGTNTLLMMKKDTGDKGGMLQAYVLQGKYLAMFVPNRDKRDEFMERYSHSGITIGRSYVNVPKLDEKAIEVFKEIVGNPDYWVEMNRYVRQ